MDNVEFIAFDLETIGLSPDFNRIVEVGAVRFRADGTELNRMEQLVDPRCAMPTDVTKIHGITDDMVHGQPPIEDVLPEFVRFLGHSETILLAHNASFDVGFPNGTIAWLRRSRSAGQFPSCTRMARRASGNDRSRREA